MKDGKIGTQGDLESDNASKPNPRFDRGVEMNSGTTSEESAIKSKVKELEKAMSIDEQDVNMGESHAQKGEIDHDELRTQKEGEMKEGKLFIQFGSLSKQVEVNTTFTLPMTFEAKEGQQVPNNENVWLQRRIILR